MAYPTRNTSSYTLPFQNTGYLAQEDGFAILQENGDKILIENPLTQDPLLTSRNLSTYSLPTRN